MTTRIKLRRDTAANWEIVNPTLALGEAGYDLDAMQLKIGDGVTAWMDLPYIGSQASTGNFTFTDSTANVTPNTAMVLTTDYQESGITYTFANISLDPNYPRNLLQTSYQETNSYSGGWDSATYSSYSGQGVITFNNAQTIIDYFNSRYDYVDNFLVIVNGGTPLPVTGASIYPGPANIQMYVPAQPAQDPTVITLVEFQYFVRSQIDQNMDEGIIRMDGGLYDSLELKTKQNLTLINNTNVWRFNSDGSTTLPNGQLDFNSPYSRFKDASNTGVQLGSPDDQNYVNVDNSTVTIQTNSDGVSGPHETPTMNWTFDNSGNFTLPYQNSNIIGAAGITKDSAAAIDSIDKTQLYLIVNSLNPHGLSNGDKVYFENLGGSTELNGNSYYVNVVNDHGFNLVSTVDNHTLMSSEVNEYTGGGDYYAGSSGSTVVIQGGGVQNTLWGDPGGVVLVGSQTVIVNDTNSGTWIFNPDNTLDLSGEGVIRNKNYSQNINAVSSGGGYTQLEWTSDYTAYTGSNPNQFNQDNGAAHYLWVDGSGININTSEMNSNWRFTPDSVLNMPDYSEIAGAYEVNVTARNPNNINYFVKEFMPVSGNEFFIRGVDYYSDGTIALLGVSYSHESAWYMHVGATGGILDQYEFTNHAYADSMAVDSSGNTYVALRDSRGPTIVQILNGGGLGWQANFNALNPNNSVVDLETDSAGNVFVLCNIQDYNGSGYNAWTLLKLNSNGTEAWQATVTSVTDANPHNETAGGMAVDANGRVLVVSSADDINLMSISLIVFNSDGTQAWKQLMTNEFGSFSSLGFDAAVDPSGNWYVYSVYGTNGLGTNVTKLNPDGMIQWSKSYQGTCIDFAANMTWGDDGFIHIFGSYTDFQNYLNEQTYIRKIDPATGDTVDQRHFGKLNKFNISTDYFAFNGPYSDKSGRLLAYHNDKLLVSGLTLDQPFTNDAQRLMSWVAQIPVSDYVQTLGDYKHEYTNFQFQDSHPNFVLNTPNIVTDAWTVYNDTFYSTQLSYIATQDYYDVDRTWTFRDDGFLDTPQGSIGPQTENNSFEIYSDTTAFVGLNWNDRGYVYIESSGAGIDTYDSNTDTSYNWQFSNSGYTSMPGRLDVEGELRSNGTIYQNGNPVLVPSVSAPDQNTAIASADDFQFWVNNNGDLFVLNGGNSSLTVTYTGTITRINGTQDTHAVGPSVLSGNGQLAYLTSSNGLANIGDTFIGICQCYENNAIYRITAVCTKSTVSGPGTIHSTVVAEKLA